MYLNKVYGNLSCIQAVILLTLYFGRISCSNAATPTSVQSIISGFLPSPVKYFAQDEQQQIDQTAAETNAIGVTSTKPDKEERGHDGRFGYPISGGETNYGGAPPGIYAPTKIDLGGVLIGAIIGFGAVVILPKLLHIISTPSTQHQGYSRGIDDMTSGVMNVIDRIDFALHEQNINTTVCIERAFCQTLQSSSPGSFIDIMTRNPVFTYLIDGSRVKGIMEVSRSINGCDHLIMKCPMSQDVITNGVRAIINV